MTEWDEAAVIHNLKAQHEGTEGLAIENTSIRRISTLIALKTTARLFKRNRTCIPISKNLIVKTGPYVHLAEVATMRFVAENTSLPVPKVFCSFLHKDRAYIVMERIEGETMPGSKTDLRNLASKYSIN
jgi:aminoglycoside phosphotransferase